METSSGSKLLTRYFILVWLAFLCLNMCQNLLNNTISLYINVIGMSTSFSGFLGIPYAIAAIFMRFFGGYCTDRFNRRMVMSLGCLIYGITAWFFGFFATAAALILFRMIHGAAFSAGQLAISTANVDVTPPEKANLGIGIFWVATAISLGGAGYLVVSLTNGSNYSLVFLASALFGIAGGVCCLLCNYEKKPEFQARLQAHATSLPCRGAHRFFEPGAMRPAVLMFLMAIGMSSLSFFLLLFAANEGYSNAGFALVVAAIFMGIGNLCSNRLLHRLGSRLTLLLAFALCAIGYAAMGLYHTEFTYFLGGAVYGFVQGICMPVLYFLAVDGMPVHRRGIAGGTVYFLLDIGMGLGSYLWGLLISGYGFTVTFLCAAATQVLACVLTFAFYPGGRRTSNV
ncbi:MAG: transporter [Oscillospiraceae bacterium]|nr:transporter [Oscillospiraceae bacterium]